MPTMDEDAKMTKMAVCEERERERERERESNICAGVSHTARIAPPALRKLESFHRDISLCQLRLHGHSEGRGY